MRKKLVGTLFASKSIKKSMQNRNASKVASRSPQERPTASQDASRTPPGRPQIAPRPSKTLPRCPPDPDGHPQDGPKGFSEAPGPRHFFGKIDKFEIVEKISKTQSTMFIHDGHSTQSLTKIESRSQRSNPRGWRRWSRKALFNPPPPAQHGKRSCRAANEKLSENNVVNALDFSQLTK